VGLEVVTLLREMVTLLLEDGVLRYGRLLVHGMRGDESMLLVSWCHDRLLLFFKTEIFKRQLINRLLVANSLRKCSKGC
jgi:hypothetical protein